MYRNCNANGRQIGGPVAEGKAPRAVNPRAARKGPLTVGTIVCPCMHRALDSIGANDGFPRVRTWQVGSLDFSDLRADDRRWRCRRAAKSGFVELLRQSGLRDSTSPVRGLDFLKGGMYGGPLYKR